MRDLLVGIFNRSQNLAVRQTAKRFYNSYPLTEWQKDRIAISYIVHNYRAIQGRQHNFVAPDPLPIPEPDREFYHRHHLQWSPRDRVWKYTPHIILDNQFRVVRELRFIKPLRTGPEAKYRYVLTNGVMTIPAIPERHAHSNMNLVITTSYCGTQPAVYREFGGFAFVQGLMFDLVAGRQILGIPLVDIQYYQQKATAKVCKSKSWFSFDFANHFNRFATKR